VSRRMKYHRRHVVCGHWRRGSVLRRAARTAAAAALPQHARRWASTPSPSRRRVAAPPAPPPVRRPEVGADRRPSLLVRHASHSARAVAADLASGGWRSRSAKSIFRALRASHASRGRRGHVFSAVFDDLVESGSANAAPGPG